MLSFVNQESDFTLLCYAYAVMLFCMRRHLTCIYFVFPVDDVVGLWLKFAEVWSSSRLSLSIPIDLFLSSISTLSLYLMLSKEFSFSQASCTLRSIHGCKENVLEIIFSFRTIGFYHLCVNVSWIFAIMQSSFFSSTSASSYVSSVFLRQSLIEMHLLAICNGWLILSMSFSVVAFSLFSKHISFDNFCNKFSNTSFQFDNSVTLTE